MKSVDRGMSFSVITLSFLLFLQVTFPYYLFANNYNISVPTFVSTSIPTIDFSTTEIDGFEKQDHITGVTGGPDQPEVQSFTPMGTSDMVDPFTGDFSYNIPLMEVDGYPINIGYNGGVGMEQEATWVGLGWSLNPGVINRSLRGIPDDFSGDELIEHKNLKKNVIVSTSFDADIELFAVNMKKGNLNLGLGIAYNNFSGINADLSFGPALRLGQNVGATIGQEFSSSTSGGATVGLNVGFFMKNNEYDGSLGVGSAANSRQGIQQLTISGSLSKTSELAKKNLNNNVKKSANNKGSDAVGVGRSSSFNVGMSTFTPQLRFSTVAKSYTARFKFGPDAIGLDASFMFSGSFYESKLQNSRLARPSFGYRNLQNGQFNPNAQLDFNRENDGNFTINTPALPLTHLTYDIFSVSGHGIAGSYRMDREDIGYTFDPKVTIESGSTSVGGEANLGTTFKTGVDISITRTSGVSQAWSNDASQFYRYNSGIPRFREASELGYDRSDRAFDLMGGDQPVYFELTKSRKLLPNLRTDGGIMVNDVSVADKKNLNRKSQYFQRNQVLTPLSIGELKLGFGYTTLNPGLFANTSSQYDHHIGAFTVTNTEGMRYYYGIPAFSYFQENVAFNVGKEYDFSNVVIPNINHGVIQYLDEDASINNNKGIDHYYNSSTTPAYAHSYLLSCVLSPNYVDTDGIKGPTKGDIGDFITFDYKKIDNYQWRNPVEEKHAYYDAGLYTDVSDDKANFIYGKKELFYLDVIETKNHIVIFYTSDRLDARSVKNRDGGLSNVPEVSMQKLDSIKLFSRADYELNSNTAKPIKTVHFTYDYSLCENYPGTVGYNTVNRTGQGKLTLKEIYFTHQKSKKGMRNKYQFYYGFNPHYNQKNVDRWGNYKRNPNNINNSVIDSELKNSDFPYVGNVSDSVNRWAGAWNLTEIRTPTGGRITVQYEADDYAYVQHKKASQMFLIEGVGGQTPDSKGIVSISDDAVKNRQIKFKLLAGTSINDYAAVGDEIYFKAALSMDKNKNSFDYVPGYAKIESITQDGVYGVITLKGAKLNDNGNNDYNPMSVAGIQFARNYLQRLIPPNSSNGTLPTADDALALMKALGATLVNFREIFVGPNLPLWKDEIGTNLVLHKSWIKLKNPNAKKLGGGYRVKQVIIYDNWNVMAPAGTQSHYGQEYFYHENGKSTGVASYEPQIGGEENSWTHYLANDIKMTLAPDSRNYLEAPFGELAFPSPSVGYSKVITKGISYSGVTKNVTGYTENEFYTAKDFPTIVKRTSIKNEKYKFNLNLILVSSVSDRLALSQGFVIENNDMHGKAKAVKIYGGKDALISSVNYNYLYDTIVVDGASAFKIKNEVTIIEKNGAISKSTIGRTYEAVADFRESTTKVYSGGTAINLNFTAPFILLPMILGANITKSDTELKTASFVKTIERKGILYQTVAIDNQSKIVTNNLAYDAETGDLLLTSVNNSFRDTIYNFTYPAHWVYEGMGQASKNIEYTNTNPIHVVDGYTSDVNAINFFEGDEVMVKIYGSGNPQVFQHKKAWVIEVNVNGIRLIGDDNLPLNGTIRLVKILRSGRRNLQSVPVGTITLSKNPLLTLRANVFEEVLNAQAIQYDFNWKRFCSCDDDFTNLNPYKSGLKGNWFPTSTYVHLSNRTQDFENENTNIRKDGVYESFNPMFKLENGVWKFDKNNWTTTTQVTEFSPNGEVMETRDPLNRFSTNQLGYNQSLQVAVSANAQKRQVAYTNFEDYAINHCPDKFIKWKKGGNPINLSDLQMGTSHSASYSLKVTDNAPIIFNDTISNTCSPDLLCDFSNVSSIQNNVTYITLPHFQGIEMRYEILKGNPQPIIQEINQGTRLSFTSASAFKVLVYLEDKNGCKETIIIE